MTSAATDPRAAFEAIVRASAFMTLATADATGLPWASPVWFATADFREYFWASSPEARHSRNLAARPELAISIFDSGQKPGTGQGAYIAAIGAPVPESELDRGLEVYAAQDESLPAWTRADVLPPAKHRLYRATASELFILDSRDTRTPVPLP
jgi:Pyridoxamine 5'-phosphate oxidase